MLAPGKGSSLPARALWPVLALVAVAYFAFPNATVDFTRWNADDSGFYLALAESLADGRGFTLYQAPLYAPSNHWPPVFPLALAGVIRAFGLDLLALKIAMVVLGLATLAAVYLFFTRVRPTQWALIVVALAAVSPLYFSFSHQTMADVPILLGIVLALAAIDRWYRLGCPFGGSAFWLAIVTVTLSYAIKLQTIVLLALPLVHYLVNRNSSRLSAKRVIAFCCVASIPFGAWAARGAWLERAGYRQAPQIYYVSPEAPSEEGWGWAGVSQLSDLFGRPARETLRVTVENAKWRVMPSLAEQVVPLLSLTPWRTALPGWASLLLSGALLLPVGVGWIAQCRERETLVTSFYALQGLTILTATEFGNPRYLVCLIPFTFFYFLSGLEAMGANRWMLQGSSASLLAAGAAALIVHVGEVRRHPYATPAQADFVAAAAWSRTSLEADAAILGHNWSELHVLSGRSTYPMLSPPGVGLGPWLEISARPIYVLAPNAEALAAISGLDKCPASWRRWLAEHPAERSLVFENAYYRIERLDDLPLDLVMGGAYPSGGRGAR